MATRIPGPLPSAGKLTKHSTQVALRVFRNSSAALANKIDKPYDPSSKAKGPSDLLTRYKITEVTPRMIAYAAVHVGTHRLPPPVFIPLHSHCIPPQTYIGLSALPSWNHTDGAFSLIRFYHLIVKTLSDDTDPWVAETIGWWER